MSDLAKGPAAGYIYQFEIALLELSNLSNSEAISIEKVDDIAVEDEKCTYVFTVQAKHSISTGNNFGNTSEDLWKTLKIWITKLQTGTLSESTKYKAITNKKIPSNSIIHFFGKIKFDDLVTKIEIIRSDQEKKFLAKQLSGKNATGVKKIIALIDFCLENKKQFEIITNNIYLNEGLEVKENFINKIFLESAPQIVKDNIYQGLLGWLFDKSKEYWLDKKEAIFKKSDFDYRYNFLRDQHTLIKAIFRNKKDVKIENPIDFSRIDYTELYIRQLQDIDRNEQDKSDIIKEAIIDYIFCDIEITNIITNNNNFTKHDFEQFEETCAEEWNKIRRSIVKHNLDTYKDHELNDFAIRIFDNIMNDLKIEFKEHFGFDNLNRYIQNGTFLKLSNIPKIGWHPNWKTKY